MSQKKSDRKSAASDPHRTREQAKYDAPIASREFITSVLSSDKGPMDIEALAEALDLAGDPVAEEALRRRVGAMIRDGQLIQNRRRGLVPVDTDALIAGRISAHPDGFGFVIADDGDKDIYLNGKQMRQVLHGDRVVVCVTGTDHRGRREGRIVDVVERANKSLVGRLSIDRGIVVVSPDNKRIHQDLLIAPGTLGEASDGDMVVAEIIEQPTRRHQPVGRIIEILGQHLKAGMEIDVALHSHGIPVEWPDAVTAQAAAFSPTVANSAGKNRKDVRDLPLITIDGIDARDFDDAVWCEPLDNGWRLMVAIADVAHYVSEGSALDNEAVERGTSVYFPGRVVPMLPEVLSNGLCSLNPEVDRLCMICEMTLDASAHVKKTRFHNGIMRSHARLTYDQVGEMLSDSRSSLRDQYAPLVPMIDELYLLYKALAAKRRERGAIEFDSNETHIVFDDNKKIREIVPIQRNDAHKLIEECMILANIEAAAFLDAKEIPALYRVHAGPKEDRLEDLRAFLALRGLSLNGGDRPSAIDYATLAEQISDRQDRSVIQTVMLRSMQQAVYQPKNEGHFGLALDQYAHFTSPIRRYPDLLVHRAIKHALLKGKPAEYRYSKEAMQVLGESCSMTERRAEEASRDVVAWLKCEYMQEHVGSEFPGVISAVTSFGLFVELVGIHVEGLLHITNLSRDYYRFEQAAHALTGERTGKQYHLGDAITVKVASVNLEERKIDFSEAGQEGRHQKTQSSKRKPRHAKAEERSSRQKQRSTKNRNTPARERETAVINKPAEVAHAISAEKRRQDKRRIKQQRRDNKRAARKEAQKLEAVRLAAHKPQTAVGGSSSQDSVVDSTESGRSAKHSADNRPRVAQGKPGNNSAKLDGKARRKAVANAADGSENKPLRRAGSKATGKAVSEAAGKTASKARSRAANKDTDKATGKVTSKATHKASSKAKSKVAHKATSKAKSKVASKASSQAKSKVASKATSKAKSKVAHKATSQAKSKVTDKASSKAKSKVAHKATSQAKGRVTSKVTSKAKSKVASKASSQAKSKVASKATNRATSKAKRNVAGTVASKVSGKKVARVTSKARSNAAGKTGATFSSNVKKKAIAKVAGKVTGRAAAKQPTSKASSQLTGNAASKLTKKRKSKVVLETTGSARGKTKAEAKSKAKPESKAKAKAKAKLPGRRSRRSDQGK